MEERKPRRLDADALWEYALKSLGARAHSIGELREKLRDYADIARLGYVTRARITQIMNLLHLAPKVQEEILFLKCAPPERSLRPLTVQPLWDQQIRLWRRLKAENLTEDLEQIAFGGDPVAIEAAKQEARRGFWNEEQNRGHENSNQAPSPP
jgi:hypothetical protein